MERGNFDFAALIRCRSVLFRAGSAFGVQTLGNGWEWPSDVFAPFDLMASAASPLGPP